MIFYMLNLPQKQIKEKCKWKNQTNKKQYLMTEILTASVDLWNNVKLRTKLFPKLCACYLYECVETSRSYRQGIEL